MPAENSVYKIKDSVDLFLSNGSYIMAYYMNTRRRKSFKVNDAMIHLLEEIDGVKTISELCETMKTYDISPENVKSVINLMVKNKIVTEVVKDQSVLTEDEKLKYARQINYFTEFLDGETAGEIAQKKILNSKVVIFGCGATGGNIALELAMAGVSNFTLYDYDIVEESDSARHMFFRQEYLNLPKVDALSKEIKLINPRAEIICVNEEMLPSSEIEKIICGSDIVINTLDEPYIGYTSAKISRVCMKYKIVHYIAGGFDAHLASTGELIIPFVTPCVECYAGHFKKTLAGWKPKKHPVQARFNEIGGLACMSLFSTSYACIEILKFLAGLTDIKNSYKTRGEFLFTNMELTYLNVEKNPACPICGKEKNFESET